VADDYLEASVRVPGACAALAESMMQGQGAMAVTLTNCGGPPIWEPAVGETPVWPEVAVTGLFPGDTDPAALAAALSLAPGVEAPDRVRVTGVKERDWARVWMDRFEPMRFGRHLWIVPSGYACPDPNAIQLLLDPGLAFGTGTHPTTRACLEWIDAHDLGGRSVLDFGCGSGVLGLAAALKGADRVLCVDNDPQALVATRANTARNGLSTIVEACAPEGLPGRAFDICLANILSNILLDNADLLVAGLRSGGVLVLAGIMADQQRQVSAAFEARGIGIREVHEDSGWVRIHGVRA